MKVKKRDGRIKDFNDARIEEAITKAYQEAYGQNLENYQNEILSVKENSIIELQNYESPIFVEKIQDVVISNLNKINKKVGKLYKKYRIMREEEREKNSLKEKFYKEILQTSNVDNDNANVDQYSFSGRKYRIADNEQKTYALRNLISPDVREAFEDGYIYIHDASSYSIGEHNCAGRETRFITDKGVKSFYDFEDGDIIKVLSQDGKMHKATVHCYGEQKLNKIIFKRGAGFEKTVRFTSNHRWLLEDGTITENLKVGDNIIFAPDIIEFDYNNASYEEKLMWCKGFACGDGTVEYAQNKFTGEYYKRNKTRIRLCGDKNKYKDRFNIEGCSVSSQTKNGDSFVKIYNYHKELPNINEISYKELKAFVDGLYCSDGFSFDKCKKYAIQFTNDELINFVKEYFESCGYYIGSMKDKTGEETNYGVRSNTIEFNFCPKENHYHYKVKAIEEDVVEDVWCLDVEETHNFVLSGGLVTGNCLFADLPRLLNNGFSTRNGDVRPANSFSTACQLVAVIFQIQSQIQYGGVASCGIDFELEPFAHKSFVKLFKEGLLEKEYITENSYNKLKNGENVKTVDGELVDVINIHIDNHELNEKFPKAYDYAIRHLEKEGKQSAQGLFHNLNTLESRAGSQVPFTSLNYGRNTSTYGKLISNWLLDASLDGIGKFHRTSIFPIGILQYKKGVNDKKGTPNYEIKRKALESLSQRIYPNFVNNDWTENVEDANDYTTFCATMGKRKLQLI